MRGVLVSLLFILASHRICKSVDVCVVSTVDIHVHHLSKFLEHLNISVQQGKMVGHGRQVKGSPDCMAYLSELTRGVIYITADLESSIRFLVRRHMSLEQARLLHGDERWLAAQTDAVTKKPLFHNSRLAEVHADKSLIALNLPLGPEDERMHRILEYVHGHGVDPIGLIAHYYRWRAAALAGRLHVPIIFLHMHPSGIGQMPYDPAVTIALNNFLGIVSRPSATYLPTLDTRIDYDVRSTLRGQTLDKSVAARILNGTAVLARLSDDMRNKSGKVYAPDHR